jgi:energy-converting hydrogenase Eha subunit A
MTIRQNSPGEIWISLLLLVPATLLNGLVIAVLWSWFVVSNFHLPPLTVAEAIGVWLLVSLVTPTPHDDRPVLAQLLEGIARSLTLFALGWVVHFWV